MHVDKIIKAGEKGHSYRGELSSEQGKGSEITWGGDFGNTDETLLTQDSDRPILVDRYPSEIKAFYFQPDSENEKLALGVDVIADAFADMFLHGIAPAPGSPARRPASKAPG